MRSSFRTIAVLTLVPVAGLVAYLISLALPRKNVSRPNTKSSVLGPRSSISPKPNPPSTEHRAPSTSSPSIVIIIDDIGYEGQRLERAMAIDPNLNFAVLPNSTRASDVAERLNDRGFEVLCHLPMEPRNGRVSAGANAVLTSMSDSEIAEATRANIAAVPHARGVNNHMGSLATTDRRVMTDVIRALPPGMYFIDSRTAGSSIASKVAREMNVKTATRHVFLDDVQSEDAVRRQLDLLSAAARAKGFAIGIGHPHDVTLRVLAREVPQLRALGFRFARASQVVN
jgi:hypothetical protein